MVWKFFFFLVTYLHVQSKWPANRKFLRTNGHLSRTLSVDRPLWDFEPWLLSRTCPAKWRLRNERRNSILMKRHHPDLGSASDWSCRVGNLIQPIRRTTQIWVVTRHQYGISVLVSRTSFGGKTSGSVAKCRLFSQATLLVICMKNEFRSKRGKTLLLLSTISSAELHLVQFVKCWQFFLKDYQSWKRHGKILNFTWRNCTNPSSPCPIKINNKGYTLSSHPCFISIHFWHVQLLKSPFLSTQQWNYTSNVHHFGRNLILLNLHLILA